jgi:hypothetical protein
MILHTIRGKRGLQGYLCLIRTRAIRAPIDFAGPVDQQRDYIFFVRDVEGFFKAVLADIRGKRAAAQILVGRVAAQCRVKPPPIEQIFARRRRQFVVAEAAVIGLNLPSQGSPRVYLGLLFTGKRDDDKIEFACKVLRQVQLCSIQAGRRDRRKFAHLRSGSGGRALKKESGQQKGSQKAESNARKDIFL